MELVQQLWLAVLLAYQLTAVLAGTGVDESGNRCSREGYTCPRDGDKSYQKYCCYDTSPSRVYCCNPYFALELGVGIGVPLVILLIVCIVVVYCFCSYRQRRRERTQYYDDYEDEEELVTTSSFKSTQDNELPPYSEADPFTEDPPEYSGEEHSTELPRNDDETANQSE